MLSAAAKYMHYKKSIPKIQHLCLVLFEFATITNGIAVL